MTKRYCEINSLEEISDLKPGMDFRKPEYRREVFKRFYKFHLKYKSHPGGVYYVMPYLAKLYNWNVEEKYWYAFINGCTQNPCTSLIIFEQFPDFKNIDLVEMEKWHKENWKRLDYDIDRRYQKGHLVEMVTNYKEIVGDDQEFFFSMFCSNEDEKTNFDSLWEIIINQFFMYGRLSTFSYMEYLKIMGLNIDCSNLFIYDASGSKSHRNGLCKVAGRDDLERHDKINPGVKHSKAIMKWAEKEGAQLIKECYKEFKGEDFFEDVGYFTLESTLCCYKSWHRVNRRYANIYNDMFYKRIQKAELEWGDKFQVMWNARKEFLPKELRLEDNPLDPGLSKVKQNWYRNTGEVLMMGIDDNTFTNKNFDDYLKENKGNI